jgi:broad specificity phosphatase PhoE
MSSRLFLVRHGRTALNAQGRFRGRLDPPLDERGVLEAAGAAAALDGAGLVAVATSPLARAEQTARAIASSASVPVIVEPALIDLDHGTWTGLTAEEAAERDPEDLRLVREDPFRARPPGGEALAEAERRVAVALAGLAAAFGGEPVAAVSHEIPIRLVCARAAGLRPARRMWELALPTGSVTELVVEDASLRLAHAIGTLPVARRQRRERGSSA